jgi:hypothetical protein
MLTAVGWIEGVGLVDFLKAIGSGVVLIVVVYCDLVVAAADHLRRLFGAK